MSDPGPPLAVHLVLHRGQWGRPVPSGRQRREAGGLLGQPNRFTTCRPPPPAFNSPPQALPASPDAASPRTGGCRAWWHRSPRPGGCRRGRGRAGPGTVKAVEGPAGSHLAAAVAPEWGRHRAGHRAAHGATRATSPAVPMATAGGWGGAAGAGARKATPPAVWSRWPFARG